MRLNTAIYLISSMFMISAMEVEVDIEGLASNHLDAVSPQQQVDALLRLKIANKNMGIDKNNNWSPHLSLSEWSNIRVASNGLVDGLFLNDLDIAGDLADLKPLFTPTLKVLQLNGNGGLAGDVALLSTAPNLKEVWLFSHHKVMMCVILV
jgi:hypothetical protein